MDPIRNPITGLFSYVGYNSLVTPEEIAADRARYCDLIVRSEDKKKLILAGPGTGKTYIFREALRAMGGGGLAMTFINNLVDDLRKPLEGLADVNTFHGFCKHLLHKTPVDGITSKFGLFPAFGTIVEADAGLLGKTNVTEKLVEQCLQTLDDSDGVIAAALQIGNRYDTVTHTDLVYRVLQHLRANPETIPAYSLIVVDEYQDFSRLETEFIDVLATKSSVLIAGDDDQALYGFKHASAQFIRQLATNAEYKRFELPYCSRCTSVIIEAVSKTLVAAKRRNLLKDRYEKQFLFYGPDKKVDSDLYPTIINAQCSIHRKSAPYISRYILKQIQAISSSQIEEAAAGGYPAALVIGPGHFVGPIHADIVKEFPGAVLKKSDRAGLDELDGYGRLLDGGNSNLAWRILLHLDPCESWKEQVTKFLRGEAELHDLLPDDYLKRHRVRASLIAKLIKGEKMTKAEVFAMEKDFGLSSDALLSALAKKRISLRATTETEKEASGKEGAPTIVCTTWLGSKGLSGGHVFLVGMNDEHFPRKNSAPTDDEVCSFIVALTRTRKRCHVISCGNFGGKFLKPSVFIEWITPYLELIKVDKAYFG